MASSLTEIATPERALVSWKEIAAFLNRAERTVKRWERERGLPVRRVPGGERGGVFAYPSELNAWLMAEQDETVDGSRLLERNYSEGDGSRHASESQLDAEKPLDATGIREAADRGRKVKQYRPWLIRVALSAAALGVAAASVYTFTSGSKNTNNDARNASASNTTAHVPTSAAEHFYLQGRYEWSLRTADSLVKSIDDYTQSIVEDSDYAPAYAGLAESYDLLPEYGRLNREEAFHRAKAAADKAIALDPNLSAGHRAKAFALFYGDWDVQASDAEFRQALKLAPDDAQTHHWYATTLFSRLDGADAISEIDQAVRLSPTTPSVVADAAFIHAFFNRDRKANIRTLREMGQTQPKLASSFRYLAELDLNDDDYPDYLADVRHEAEISHDPIKESLAAAATAGWERTGKMAMLEGVRQSQEDAFARGSETGYWLGRTYLMLGQPTQALHYLNEAFYKGDFSLMTLSACRCVAGLEKDAGYADLLRRVHERMYSSSNSH